MDAANGTVKWGHMKNDTFLISTANETEGFNLETDYFLYCTVSNIRFDIKDATSGTITGNADFYSNAGVITFSNLTETSVTIDLAGYVLDCTLATDPGEIHYLGERVDVSISYNFSY